MHVHHATDMMAEAFDAAVDELDAFMARLCGDQAVLELEHDGTHWWIVNGTTDVWMYRSPDVWSAFRFARAFMQKTPGAVLGGSLADIAGHSVKVSPSGFREEGPEVGSAAQRPDGVKVGGGTDSAPPVDRHQAIPAGNAGGDGADSSTDTPSRGRPSGSAEPAPAPNNVVPIGGR